MACDLVLFRIGWWFKFHGKGSKDSIDSILLNISELCVESSKKKSVGHVGWSPPSFGVLKFNVDGSARGKPSPAGIGGVLRDHRGQIMCLFSVFVGSQESNAAEIMAIHRAVELCASRPSLRNQEIEIIRDSQVAVAWANKNTNFGSISLVQLIYDIRSYIRYPFIRMLVGVIQLEKV
ncbi:hypothetical protein Dsin_013636 [Dipteronia sinensis]|uniref:RNase H type-1 domain-containing protein n=1 Tax=Dipteronia sinensis TaxID=43782 RepID=A0AAE0E967_9ROSI|nr:hypothetical protein Dsin_013636 [Dipteronia sinensis]